MIGRRGWAEKAYNVTLSSEKAACVKALQMRFCDGKVFIFTFSKERDNRDIWYSPFHGVPPRFGAQGVTICYPLEPLPNETAGTSYVEICSVEIRL